MALELSEYTIEPSDSFVVAGVAERGTDVDPEELWGALDDYVDDIDDATETGERYGVLFEFDESAEEFTYVVGYEVESTDGLPPELTAVEIPEASYAVFSPRDLVLDELVDELDEGLLSDADHERAEGPVFQRFDATEDPFTHESSFELFVPVDDE